MNNFIASCLTLTVSLMATPVFSQTDSLAVSDTTLLGLPGDNLDLYVVLDLFQKSKTIEEFEKSLNSSDTKVNNLDLNLDDKVDFIKVSGTKKDEDFTFVLKVDVTKDETQDVAVILVSRDKNKKVSVQIVGDKDLYGKDYIVDLKEFKAPSSTPNPGYTGDDPAPPVTASGTTVSTTTVIVEQVPIVQYVYSPAYVHYVPPYYYGFYPPYFFAASCIAVGIYRSNHYYHHYHGGYGYHGNSIHIHNTNNFNNYNNYNRNSSNTVNHYKNNGNYNRGNNASTRPSTGNTGGTRPSTQPAGGTRPSAGTQPSTRPSGGNQGTRPSTQPSTRPSTQPSTRPSTQPSTRPTTQPSTRPSTQPSTRPTTQPSTRPTTQPSTRPSSSYSGSSRPSSQPSSRPSSSYSGGGRSMGGGGYSGGSRGGGGGGGGRRR